MKKLALIGKNISHSQSQKVYESILGEKVDYTLLDISEVAKIPRPEKLFDTFEGVSITSPYKSVFHGQVFIEDPSLRSLNSINCLRKKGELYEGTSTDFFALRDHFGELIKEYGPFKVALLGDGNMSILTRSILHEMGVEYRVFSRKLGNLAVDTDLAAIFAAGQKVVVVNSCSREFVFRGKLPPDGLFWDYNYGVGGCGGHPEEYCSYKDGYSLLEQQAKYALSFWYGEKSLIYSD